MNILSAFNTALQQVWHTFSVNWPLLVISVLVAALMKLYVDQRQVSAFLQRHRRSGVLAATATAVGTPLCSCGTTAVVLGFMASQMPWAPIVAFMVASPLTSPQELFYSAGLFGWSFALTFFGASIGLGLLGGWLAHVLEQRGWLANQARMHAPAPLVVSAQTRPTITRRQMARELWLAGRQILIYFFVFAFIGYFLNGLIPAHWVATLFGSGRAYGVPLAATLGLPLYFNTEASLPLVSAMLAGGMSPGAALAFLITGAGTSVGAIAGALTIARWRVVGLVIATLWVGAIGFGLAYNALIFTGLV